MMAAGKEAVFFAFFFAFHLFKHFEWTIESNSRVVSPKTPIPMDAEWPWKHPDLISGASRLGQQ